MLFEFNQLQLPALPDAMSGPAYERMKATIVALMLGQRLEVFTAQASNDGPWAPLSRRTLKARDAKVGPAKRGRPGSVNMLVDSGILRQSFTEARGEGNAFRETSTQGDEVSLSTHVPYAAIHNFGGTIERSNRAGTKAYKVFTSGDREGQHHFASRKEVAKGDTKNYRIIEREHGGRSFSTHVTIPARPFDQFTEEQEKQIGELVEQYLNV